MPQPSQLRPSEAAPPEDGKEGVDGSSPSEGSAKAPHSGAFLLSSTCIFSWTLSYGALYGACSSYIVELARDPRLLLGDRPGRLGFALALQPLGTLLVAASPVIGSGVP